MTDDHHSTNQGGAQPARDDGDGVRAELAHIEAILRPFVAGMRAVTPRPDPRRALRPFLMEVWPGLSEQDQQLVLWHGVQTTLVQLCQQEGSNE